MFAVFAHFNIDCALIRGKLSKFMNNIFHISSSSPQKKLRTGVSVVVQHVKNPTGIHEDVGLNPGLTQWVKDPALLQAVA